MSNAPITLTISVDGVDNKIEDIPAVAWERFKEAAKKQFPKNGDDAWAAFLSEVIVAGSGGDSESVTYFMTGVPLAMATAIHNLLTQINFTSWDQFHAYLLQASVQENAVRLVNFIPEPGKDREWGTLIVTGLHSDTFRNVEAQAGVSFERAFGTILNAARYGKFTFGEETQWLEASPSPAVGSEQSTSNA